MLCCVVCFIVFYCIVLWCGVVRFVRNTCSSQYGPTTWYSSIPTGTVAQTQPPVATTTTTVSRRLRTREGGPEWPRISSRLLLLAPCPSLPRNTPLVSDDTHSHNTPSHDAPSRNTPLVSDTRHTLLRHTLSWHTMSWHTLSWHTLSSHLLPILSWSSDFLVGQTLSPTNTTHTT